MRAAGSVGPSRFNAARPLRFLLSEPLCALVGEAEAGAVREHVDRRATVRAGRGRSLLRRRFVAVRIRLGRTGDLEQPLCGGLGPCEGILDEHQRHREPPILVRSHSGRWSSELVYRRRR